MDAGGAGLNRRAFIFIALGFVTVAGKDFYASPAPTGGDLSLVDCLGNLTANDRCLLRAGHYYPPPGATALKKAKGRSLEVVEIAPAEEGSEVLIDGTFELKGLTWKTCAEEDPALACAEGVYVANLGSTSFIQLFQGGDDVADREMLLSARWPNAKAEDLPAGATDAPDWAAAFNTHKSWSFPDGKKS